MRQIYNTAESPEMTIFQLMDTMVPSVGNVTNSIDSTAVNHSFNHVPQPVIESTGNVGQTSSYRNTSRLSLANLLPSRLAFYPIYTKNNLSIMEKYENYYYDLLCVPNFYFLLHSTICEVHFCFSAKKILFP